MQKTFDKGFIDVRLEKNLNKEETLEYFKKYQNGDLSAREKLLIHNIRLVLYEVNNKFYFNPFEKEELVSVGMIGLIKAVDSFKTEKNIAFTTYAVICIDNEIRMYMKKNNRHILLDRFDSIIDEELECTLEDFIYDLNADFVSKFEEKELKENILKAIDTLCERDREIVKLSFGFYGNRVEQKEIGQMFNISQSYVSRIIDKNVKKIFNILCEKQLLEKQKTKIKKRSN